MNNVLDREIDVESGSTKHKNARLKLSKKKECNIIVNKTSPLYT